MVFITEVTECECGDSELLYQLRNRTSMFKPGIKDATSDPEPAASIV